MGADSQPGGHVLSALASHRFAGAVRFPHQTRPPVVATSFTRARATSGTPWQSLERDEQEAFIALMAQLSLRAARGQAKP